MNLTRQVRPRLVAEFHVAPVGYIRRMSLPAFDGSDGPEITVPASWKRATLGAPVPVIRCTYIFPDTHERPGEQCKRWSIRGATKCVKHGGNLDNVRQHAEAMVESARLRLIGATDQAVDWLLDLAANSTSDAVRLKATTEVMDRAGVRGGVEVDVQVDTKQDPATLIREKLEVLRKRTIEGEVMHREAEQVIEAATTADAGDTFTGDTTELQEDPDGQP